MKLTIFTATYNRSSLLKKLYNSLLNQDAYDFEWLIIDDDSNDGTEKIVRELICVSPFLIRYYKQAHGGKHRAINKGIKLAEGEYFFIVDSDDQLLSNVIQLVYKWIDSVKGINYLAGISGLRLSNNNILGGNPKCNEGDYIEASNFERLKYNLGGDKAEIYKTAILKKFPFPEFPDEYFVTEAVCWNAIANAGYKLRWYNVPIYCCNYLDGGLTKTGVNEISGHIKNYQGYCFYIKQLLEYNGVFCNPRLLNDYLKTTKILKKTFKDISIDLQIPYFKSLFIKPCIYIGFLRSALRKLVWKIGVRNG